MLENAVYRYSARFGQAVSETDKRWQSYLYARRGNSRVSFASSRIRISTWHYGGVGRGWGVGRGLGVTLGVAVGLGLGVPLGVGVALGVGVGVGLGAAQGLTGQLKISVVAMMVEPSLA